MDVVSKLKQDGISKGLCKDWQGKLRSNSSVKHLAKLFIRGIDFCISENYPTLEFMVENFKGKCEPYGIYINDKNVFLINKEDVVLNGDCDAELVYDGFSVSKIYVRHNSKVTVHAQQHSLVTIDVFDDSYTKIITDNDKASVLVYVYGNAIVESIGNGVKVIHKNKKTY